MNAETVVCGDSERDAGFTLIELLMAITLMGLILFTLGLAVSEGFQNTTTAKASIDRSILGDFAARYFAPDIASATFGSPAIATTSPPACGSGTAFIDIQTGPNSAVSYGWTQAADGSTSLLRSSCSGSVTGALTLVSRRYLGTSLNMATPSATCATTTSCALTLAWINPTYSITLTGTRWVNATTTTTGP